MAIITRTSKGTSLTIAEGDANLLELNKRLGVLQTWTDVTADRLSDVNYLNDTGRTIIISATAKAPTTLDSYGEVHFFIDDVIIQSNSSTSRGTKTNGGGSVLVPNGSTYRVLFYGEKLYFKELR